MQIELKTDFLWFTFSDATAFTRSWLIAEYTNSKTEALHNLYLIISKILKIYGEFVLKIKDVSESFTRDIFLVDEYLVG
jgi:hypothetical protein